MDAVGCLWSLIWMTPRRASRETLWFQIQATHPSAPKASALVAWRLPLRITACIFVVKMGGERTCTGVKSAGVGTTKQSIESLAEPSADAQSRRDRELELRVDIG